MRPCSSCYQYSTYIAPHIEYIYIVIKGDQIDPMSSLKGITEVWVTITELDPRAVTTVWLAFGDIGCQNFTTCALLVLVLVVEDGSVQDSQDNSQDHATRLDRMLAVRCD